MPQLDFVTYFSQGVWFNLLFWVGFFYFLYTVFPLISLLVKWRKFFYVILSDLKKNFCILLNKYLIKINELFLIRNNIDFHRLYNINKEMNLLIFQKNKLIYFNYFNYLVCLHIF